MTGTSPANVSLGMFRESFERFVEELKQAREKLENVQKEFDKLKCLLEEISKDK